MNRYLITGAAGFVARHFIKQVEFEEPEALVLCTDKNQADGFGRHDFACLELMDGSGVEALIADFRPTVIAHFASSSSVASSWTNPAATFSNNTAIFLNLLEAVRKTATRCRILSIGSSEEYGDVDPARLPLREEAPTNPSNPYGVARVAQNSLSRIYARSFGLDIVITRSFNHVGPGQRGNFVIPSTITQFIAAQTELVRLSIGEARVVRDFLDVRDVCRAYLLLVNNGESGETYNVCSGKGVSIAEVIDLIAEVSGKAYEIEVEPGRVRPTDNQIVVGDNTKLVRLTGWKPRIPLIESIRDAYEYMRRS